MLLQPAYRDRLVKLLGMLGSDHEGERANAARMAHEHLQLAGLTWCDVILATPAQETKPRTQRPWRNPARKPGWAEQAEAVAGSLLVTEWERDFAANLLRVWRGR